MLMGKHKRVRPPMRFAVEDGAVGLRIVIGSGPVGERFPRMVRSDPIPIRAGVVGPTAESRREEEEEDEDDDELGELSESYTCVTSHVGGRAVRKRVYLDDGTGGNGRSLGLFFESESGVQLGPTSGVFFLGRCCLCEKELHGIGIFMYGGDKAFCSVECRCKQILINEHKERRMPGQAVEPYDHCVSPYPSPLFFATGVAAA